MVAKCFSRHCTIVTWPTSIISGVITSIPPDFPFFIFYIALMIPSLLIKSIYNSFISFPSLSTTGCWRFSISSEWPFHLLAAQGLAIFVLKNSFSLVTYHPCYFVNCFHVPFICCWFCFGYEVFCPLSSVISHVAFYLLMSVAVFTSSVFFDLLRFTVCHLLFSFFNKFPRPSAYPWLLFFFSSLQAPTLNLWCIFSPYVFHIF